MKAVTADPIEAICKVMKLYVCIKGNKLISTTRETEVCVHVVSFSHLPVDLLKIVTSKNGNWIVNDCDINL